MSVSVCVCNTRLFHAAHASIKRAEKKLDVERALTTDGLGVCRAACECRGYCSFPAFLYEPLPVSEERDGGAEQRVWLSRVEYSGNTDTWHKRKEIVVNDTEMFVSMRIHASCSGTGYERHLAASSAAAGAPSVPCFRQDIHYHIICISEESDMKFRVQIINRKYVNSRRNQLVIGLTATIGLSALET